MFPSAKETRLFCSWVLSTPAAAMVTKPPSILFPASHAVTSKSSWLNAAIPFCGAIAVPKYLQLPVSDVSVWVGSPAPALISNIAWYNLSALFFTLEYLGYVAELLYAAAKLPSVAVAIGEVCANVKRPYLSTLKLVVLTAVSYTHLTLPTTVRV